MTVRPPGVTSILQAVEKRGETDSHPSYFVHVILPVLLVLGGILVGAAVVIALIGVPSEPDDLAGISTTVLATLGLVLVAAFIAAIVLTFRGWYLLIKRRNDHLARDRILRQGLLDYTRRVAETRGGEDAGEPLEEMERLHNEALLEENERPAIVHILLYVLTQGLWGLYVLYFLIKDFPRHTRRQGRFVGQARDVFERAGLDRETIPEVQPLDERSYLLSLALWIFVPVIGGFVVTWWLYQDPPEHFRRQWIHEDELVDLVRDEEQAPPPPSGTGAAAPTPTPDGDQEPSGAQADGEAEAPDQEEPAFTVWSCGECGKKYKVPPKRPVRVTCKNCGNKEILEE